MSAQYHSMIGLPRSGKTTFLAALWHLLDSGEIATQLVLDRLIGDHQHLNSITEAWRKCTEVPRTSLAAETKVTIHARVPTLGTEIALCFPDLSGESFQNQFASRSCSPEYVDGYARDGGVVLFVNADRPSDGMTFADLSSIGSANFGEEKATEVEWDPRMVPEQVRLVDLLQFLQRSPFERRRRRLAVLISAWDVVAARPTPEKWMEREMPLLHQFLAHNADSFERRIFGVSAQGGAFEGDQRLALARQVPSARIQCVGPGVIAHDLTAPIVWLSGGQ